MKTYLAQDKSSGLVFGGGLHACLLWSFERIKVSQDTVIVIIKCRLGEDAKIIAEVDNTGGRWIFRGRSVPKREVSKLARRACNG